MAKYIVLENKEYYVNMEKIMEFVTNTPKNERNIATVITERYPVIEDSVDDDIVSKEMIESKSSLNEVTNGIRYDLVKTFLNTLLMGITDEAPLIFNQLTFAQKLSFNTLIEYGIIDEVRKKK